MDITVSLLVFYFVVRNFLPDKVRTGVKVFAVLIGFYELFSRLVYHSFIK